MEYILKIIFQKGACGEQWDEVFNTVSLTLPHCKETAKQRKEKSLLEISDLK